MGIRKYLLCLLFCGILHCTNARSTGAPSNVCARSNLMPLHLQFTTSGNEIQPQSPTATNRISPYIPRIKGAPSDQKYGPTDVLRVQLIRNPQYQFTSANFRGLILQMRAGTPALPVGKFELDPNQPENQLSVLNYDFSTNYKILQCPRQIDPSNPSSPSITAENSVTHTNNNDKRVTAGDGPVFIWRPTINDGIWTAADGYGRIHAKAAVVMDRETFWVQIQTSFLSFRDPCLNNGPCGSNGVCAVDTSPLGYVCNCNTGWFGDTCQYNCAVSGNSPNCVNGGSCNSFGTNVNLCTCLPGFTGTFCQTVAACANSPCGSNGNCAADGSGSYVCTCFNGWFGNNCQYFCNDINAQPPCQNGGSCNAVDNQERTNGKFCDCPIGYSGSFCTSGACSANPCGTFGTCAGDLNNAGAFTCTCNNNYFGSTCQYNCQFSPPQCLNGGICNTNTLSQSTQFCTCLSNAAGPLCASYITCPDVSPVNTPGTQTAVSWNVPQMTGFALVDPFFFYSVNGVSLPTQTNGNQVSANFNLGTTTVTVQGTDGILDVTCNFNVEVQATTNACTPNNPCQNGGVCNLLNGGSAGYFCDCTTTLGRYTGLQCTVDDCYELCPGGSGQCLRCPDYNQCQKDSNNNFAGCSTACVTNPCNNNGQCFDGGAGTHTCVCFNGWTGSDCTMPAGCNLNPCNPEGTQTNGCQATGQTSYMCLCNDVWLGTNCEYKHPCRSSLGPPGQATTCSPGLCTEVTPIEAYPSSRDFANFVCSCPVGLQGTFCEIPICNPGCLNGGQCSLNNGQPTCFCLQGWTGSSCSILESCVNLGCQNGGVCQPLNGDPLVVSCNCANTGYTGTLCDQPICNPACQNGGQCSLNNGQATCFCLQGWAGTDCSIPDCNPTCQNGGQCSNNNGQATCFCLPGWTGSDCSIPVCSPACLNLGNCVSLNGVPTCQCRTGFTGSDCGTPVCTPTCQNGGACIVDSSSGLPICSCPATFTGVDCSTPVCSPICQNGGVCGVTGGVPTCQCPAGYDGPSCTIPTGCNAFPCLNNGFCQPTSSLPYYECFCTNPYSGTNCEQRNDCIVTTCQNGGTCQTDSNGVFTTCEPCDTGYSGTLCQIYNPCTTGLHQCVNGQCIPNAVANFPYLCQCDPGWHGQFCQNAPVGCSDSPCLNGGVCSTQDTHDFSCACINGWFGQTCLYRDACIYNSVNCLNGGTCTSDPNTGVFVTCEPCNTGYSGQFCQNDVCNNNQCVNGNCIRTGTTTYACQCLPNWLGEFCNQPLQTGCTPNPCLSGGICTPVGNTGFTCACPDNYYGIRCENSNGCNSVTCQNGGQCTINPVTGAFMGCVNCNVGYSGPYCQLYVCDYHFCTNGGVCVPLSSSDYRCNCLPQWLGDYCDRPASCVSQPCQNGGVCSLTADGGYTCQCDQSQWTGPTCSIPVACQTGAQNPCQNGGICRATGGSNYFCDCTPTWTGEYCHIALACEDPTVCENGGVCEHDSSGLFIRCRCPAGYLGTYCELDGCLSNPCGAHGYCDAVDNQYGYTCTCFDGYTGQNCDLPPVCGYGFANNPCYPHGTCTASTTSPTGYLCDCDNGFYGPNCQNQDPCYNHQCMNGGQCTSDGFGSYDCECFNGYSGLYCEVRPICLNNPCYNGGRCVPVLSSGLQYECICSAPYVGIRCEILSGCSTNPCSQHGRCESDDSGGYECICLQGYTGRHCSIAPVCVDNPCYNGDCVLSASGQPTCSCYPGYFGPYCQIQNQCYSYVQCLNGGTCEFDDVGRATCICTEEFRGERCDIPNLRLCLINICQNGATCWDDPQQGSVCTCIEGFGGDLCEHRILSCAERYCDKGICIEADNSRDKTSYCECDSGWTGDQCNQRYLNGCLPNPCLNGGTCDVYNPQSGQYQCSCKSGYSGINCQSRTPPIIIGGASQTMVISLWTLLIALSLYLIFGRL